MFKSHYVVWKLCKCEEFFSIKIKFKSHYVVWKHLSAMLGFLHVEKFKSHYVVWKQDWKNDTKSAAGMV